VPHNLYVQTLTKTGAVGLAALVVTVASALAALAGMARQAAGDIPPPHLDGALALAGFLALVAALGYGVAYYLEPVTLLLVGLGVAAAVHGEEPCVAPAPDVAWAARWARGAAGETPS
jgi:O-antigen ligase